MTKADIVRILSEQVGLTRREAADALKIVLDGVIGAIRRGEKVELRGFGSFRTGGARLARSQPAHRRPGQGAAEAGAVLQTGQGAPGDAGAH
jgi:nucleoid DNA-binding protein